MRMTSLRLAILLVTLVASLHAAAAPRFWTLTGVQLADGTTVTGYFSFDDVAHTFADWNVRVSPGTAPFIPWTYVPGNSGATWPGLYLSSYVPSLLPGFPLRTLIIRPAGALDGSSASVSINLSASFEFFEIRDYYYSATGPSRKAIAGSLTLSPSPPVTIVQVDEFYHPSLRHYFITADAAEKQLLDTGVHPGWERTTASFKAYAQGSRPSGSIRPVCRYYGDPQRGLDSHFFSADSAECVRVFVGFGSEWLLESDNAFQIDLPDTSTGACPTGTVPVYRLWNQRGDSNHRYTTSLTIRAQMLAAGYVAEGYGPNAVAMCAVQ